MATKRRGKKFAWKIDALQSENRAQAEELARSTRSMAKLQQELAEVSTKVQTSPIAQTRNNVMPLLAINDFQNDSSGIYKYNSTFKIYCASRNELIAKTLNQSSANILGGYDRPLDENDLESRRCTRNEITRDHYYSDCTDGNRHARYNLHRVDRETYRGTGFVTINGQKIEGNII